MLLGSLIADELVGCVQSTPSPLPKRRELTGRIIQRCPQSQKCCGGYDDVGCNGDCCGTSGKCCPDDSCCYPPNVCCGGSCTDPSAFQSDPNNCGSCGYMCPAATPPWRGAFCCQGSCISCPQGPPDWVVADTKLCQCYCNCAALGDPSGLDKCNCGGICKDLAHDQENCGHCGQWAGDARWKCCNGTPTAIAADPTNCGDCGNVCSGKIPRCCFGQNGGGCVDAASDPQNCGKCGQPCPPPGTCVNGVCECPAPPWMKCGGICVDTSVSQLNCGSCGNACLPGELCCDGHCACNCSTGTQCSPIETCCSGACVNTQIDVHNCSGCGKECLVYIGNGASTYGVCVGGQCQCPANLILVPAAPPFGFDSRVCCPPSTPNLCGDPGVCTNLSNDADNCGKCGHVCPAGQACLSGRCECPVTEQQCGTNENGDPICCAPGLECCDGQCVNTQTTAANCGGCGVNCGSGSCLQGHCQCPPGSNCGAGCCSDPTHPVCLPASWMPGGGGCCPPGSVSVCPPTGDPNYPNGYCCAPGTTCCSTGCCRA